MMDRMTEMMGGMGIVAILAGHRARVVHRRAGQMSVWG